MTPWLTALPDDNRLEAFARHLFQEHCLACFACYVPSDCTPDFWADLDADRQEVWRRVARKAQLYLARNALPSAS